MSSFGFSGTNAHLILESAPPRPALPGDTRRPRSVLALSAKSGSALTEMATRYGDRLRADPSGSLADLCFSASTGRSHFRHRLAAVAGTARTATAETAPTATAGTAPTATAGTAAGAGRPAGV